MAGLQQNEPITRELVVHLENFPEMGYVYVNSQITTWVLTALFQSLAPCGWLLSTHLWPTTLSTHCNIICKKINNAIYRQNIRLYTDIAVIIVVLIEM